MIKGTVSASVPEVSSLLATNKSSVSVSSILFKDMCVVLSEKASDILYSLLHFYLIVVQSQCLICA